MMPFFAMVGAAFSSALIVIGAIAACATLSSAWGKIKNARCAKKLTEENEELRSLVRSLRAEIDATSGGDKPYR